MRMAAITMNRITASQRKSAVVMNQAFGRKTQEPERGGEQWELVRRVAGNFVEL
jgi:hypothetical protein